MLCTLVWPSAPFLPLRRWTSSQRSTLPNALAGRVRLPQAELALPAGSVSNHPNEILVIYFALVVAGAITEVVELMLGRIF